ncbi:MAG: hypothetical protein Q7K57_15040 [Burkholderiaceae bacterium]|nr:hypothetical protein [Burkholderiaceae bacterium]
MEGEEEDAKAAFMAPKVIYTAKLATPSGDYIFIWTLEITINNIANKAINTPPIAIFFTKIANLPESDPVLAI